MGRKVTIAGASILVVVALVVGLGWFWGRDAVRSGRLPWTVERSFPAVTTAGLDPARIRIVDHLRREFAANHPGSYYSEGVKEPWCADFVSTVLRDAQLPLTNPNSGSWRIPGVFTLTEYFQHEGRLRPPSYTPVPGDVALYEPPHALGQHTNIVVAVDGGTVTTVGGNQSGGISALTYRLADTSGIVGYGVPVA